MQYFFQLITLVWAKDIESEMERLTPGEWGLPSLWQSSSGPVLDHSTICKPFAVHNNMNTLQVSAVLRNLLQTLKNYQRFLNPTIIYNKKMSCEACCSVASCFSWNLLRTNWHLWFLVLHGEKRGTWSAFPICPAPTTILLWAFFDEISFIKAPYLLFPSCGQHTPYSSLGKILQLAMNLKALWMIACAQTHQAQSTMPLVNA